MKRFVLLAGALLLLATSVSEAGPFGLFGHRGCCEESAPRRQLFHRGGNGCAGGMGGGYTEVACCQQAVATGCQGGFGGYRATPCPECPGGVRYIESHAGLSGTQAPPTSSVAIPDGSGGYRIVQVTGFHNGIPIVDPQGTAANVQQPQRMPVK